MTDTSSGLSPELVERLMKATSVGDLERDMCAFVSESNKIEGILRAPHREELDNTAWFLSLPEIGVNHVEGIVSTYEPRAILRKEPHLNVRVGSHVAPPGGLGIVYELEALLKKVNANQAHPYILHQEYETLHPFTDGNGRSGRAIWAWQMLKFGYHPGIQLGFLHAFYYQALEQNRAALSAALPILREQVLREQFAELDLQVGIEDTPIQVSKHNGRRWIEPFLNSYAKSHGLDLDGER